MRNLLLPLTLVLGYYATAQYKSEKLTYYDESGHECKEKKAALLQQTIQLDDTLWEFNIYAMYRPRIVSFQSNSPEGKILTGRYLHYNLRGQVDTLGSYSDGKRRGLWSAYRDVGFNNNRKVADLFYQDGELLWVKDTMQIKHEEDSVAALHPKDTVKQVEIESEFPGGAQAWLRFMNKNLRYPDDAVDKRIMGTTIVGFIVDKEGEVGHNSIWLFQSVMYSIDNVSIGVILKSGKWTPAVQNGKNVKSYKKQPIVFRYG